ncbi:hypothetical protein [Streptomyces sp. NPDC048636]|uniref:hypothetical protein n=1 Tax=Streptomyces sp. NPDC048636 TaxID=3155762 RepID=UPI0034172DD9
MTVQVRGRCAGGLRVIAGGAVLQEPLVTGPWQFRTACVDAFVASWRARGFSPVTIDNDIGLLERTLAVKGRATSTRHEYVQIFKGFHRFLRARKAAEIEAAFDVRLVCPVEEFNASRHVGDDSPSLAPPPTPERMAEFDLVDTMDPKLVAAAFGMDPQATLIYLADHIDPGRLPDQHERTP